MVNMAAPAKASDAMSFVLGGTSSLFHTYSDAR
jgi:hypothetical protein